MISIIVGGGPSLEKINLDLIKPHYCIGCNAAFFLGDWIDAMIFGDCRFNTWYGEDLKRFKGQKHTLCPHLEHDPTFIYWKKLQNKCFTLQHGRIGWHTNKGPNTGSAAINLACQLGFRKIVLVGFDGQVKNDKHNWHNYYKGYHTPSPTIYNRFHKHFRCVAEELDGTEFEVINCTPGTKLDMFRKEKLEEVLK
jgi:hypothetical protein